MTSSYFFAQIWFQNRRAKWRRQDNFTSQMQNHVLDQTSVTSTSLVSDTKYSSPHDLEAVSASLRKPWTPNDNGAANISYHNNFSWPNSPPFAPLPPYLSPFLEFPSREALVPYDQVKQPPISAYGYSNFLPSAGGSTMARVFDAPAKEFMPSSQGFLPQSRHVGLPLNCGP